MRARVLAGSTLAVIILCGGAAAAQDRGRRGPPPAPPPEAISACSGQASGATCRFAHDGREVTGTCRPGPGDLPAACFPAGGPHHGGPPAEALQACSGMKEGETCAVTLGGDTLDGTCRAGPGGRPLACLPKDLPPPPPPQ